SALGPELSSDYDERTRLFSYRYVFGWFGGLAILALAYGVFLVPDARHPIGLHNEVGYSHMAMFGAVAMAIAILGSSLGLQREVRLMPVVTMA
ncbi:MFS transporter, partial [Acinetobacter baumannii]